MKELFGLIFLIVIFSNWQLNSADFFGSDHLDYLQVNGMEPFYYTPPRPFRSRLPPKTSALNAVKVDRPIARTPPGMNFYPHMPTPNAFSGFDLPQSLRRDPPKTLINKILQTSALPYLDTKSEQVRPDFYGCPATGKRCVSPNRYVACWKDRNTYQDVRSVRTYECPYGQQCIGMGNHHRCMSSSYFPSSLSEPDPFTFRSLSVDSDERDEDSDDGTSNSLYSEIVGSERLPYLQGGSDDTEIDSHPCPPSGKRCISQSSFVYCWTGRGIGDVFRSTRSYQCPYEEKCIALGDDHGCFSKHALESSSADIKTIPFCISKVPSYSMNSVTI